MPQHGRPFIKGRLYIKFNVDFPDSGFISPDQCQLLEKILPQKSSKKADMELDDCEETILHDVNNLEEEMRRRKQQRSREAYDEDDDDDEPSTQRVQCAQQ